MKTRIRIVLPVLLFIVFVMTGVGYSQPYSPAYPLYFGIFGGYVAPQNINWSSKVTGASADFSLDGSGLVGLKLGYIVPQARALAFEAEWNYMFQQNMPAQRAGSFTESGNVALNNFLVNLILRYPDGKVHPYIGGGIGGSSMNLQNTESGGGVVTVANETASAFAWQLLAGINVELAPNLSADLGYRYFGTNPSFTFINTTYRAQAVTFGLNFHF